MAGWQVALLVLAAVFVGMWIPVSLQLFATLRSGKKTLEAVRSQGSATFAQLLDTAASLQQTSAEIGELARSANEMKASLRIITSIGAAVGPAMIALLRALHEPAAAEASAGNGTPPAGEAPSPAAARPRSPSSSD
jgi:hypothetical protein